MDLRDIFKGRTFNTVASTYSGASSTCSTPPPFVSTYKTKENNEPIILGPSGGSEDNSGLNEHDLTRIYNTYFAGFEYIDKNGNEYYIVEKQDMFLKAIVNPQLNNIKSSSFSKTQFLSRMGFTAGYYNKKTHSEWS